MFGVALMDSVPASTQTFVPVGSVVPSLAGLTLKVTWYWVFQFQVMFESAVIVKVTEVPVPEEGTLPVPVQPVQTYCVPSGPAIGEVTDSVMTVAELNQPLAGVGEPYAESTLRVKMFVPIFNPLK